MAASHREAIHAGGNAVNRLNEKTSVDMMQAVRLIGGSMIGIAVLVVVLNEVFSLQQIANDSGPFADVINSLESTGGAALGLLVIGLLVVGANRVMGFFGGGGF
jgi:hypothetical protein